MSKRTFALLIAFLMLAGALVSCGEQAQGEPASSENPASDSAVGSDPGTDTETEAPQTEEPIPDPHPEETPVLLETGDSTISLSVRDGLLFVSTLSAKENGQSLASGTVPMSLPSSYKLPDPEDTQHEPKGDLFDFHWEYRDCTYHRGAPKGEDPDRVDFLFADPETNSTCVVSVSAYPDCGGPFEISAVFESGFDGEICLVPRDIFAFDSTGASVPVAWSFKKEGGVADGWTIYNGKSPNNLGTGISRTSMEAGTVIRARTTANHTWDSKDDIPILYLEYPGEGCVYAALEWIHGTLTAESPSGQGETVLSCKLGDLEGFATSVAAGGSFQFPPVYLGVSGGDVDECSNTFKRWFLQKKAPDRILENECEPLIQEDMQMGLEAADYGIEAIKWDYKWWAARGAESPEYDEGYIGEPNEIVLGVMRAYGAETIAEFAAMAKERGLSLTIYTILKDSKLEEEGVPTSVGPDAHPEWFANRVVNRNRSADLGNEECLEFYKGYLLSFFRDNGVQTMRSDWEPVCWVSKQKNRHYASGSDVQYWCAVGFYDLIDYLYESMPDFRYECCSSGGSMKDFATMRRAVVINCDDSSDYMSLRTTFYDTSYCIHPAQLQLPTNASTYYEGSEYYTGTGDLVAGFRTQLLCGVMLSNWVGPTAEDRQLWETYLDIYKQRIRPLIREGDLYHILPRPDSVHWDGVEYIDPDSGNEYLGVVMLWKPSDEEGPEKTVVLRGLDEDASYELVFHDRPEQNTVRTGRELMTEGFTVRIEEASGSEWVWIRAASAS